MGYTNPIPKLSQRPNEVPQKGNKYASQIIEDYREYSHIFFAFMDVLGFKQAFDENRDAPSAKFAKEYADVFRYYSQLIASSKFASTDPSYAGQTSDTLYYYTDRIDYLAEFVKVYLHFSLYAMSKNVFFRGGIANGCLFTRAPHQFYGNCVIRAYLLEERISKYPRVALDKVTYENLSKTLDLADAFYCDSTNGRFYLNPFVKILENELAAITNLEPSYFQKISKKDVLTNIKRGAVRFEFDEHNYPKYQFLLRAFEESSKVFE